MDKGSTGVKARLAVKMKLFYIVIVLIFCSCSRLEPTNTWDLINESLEKVDTTTTHQIAQKEYLFGDLMFKFTEQSDPYELGLYQRLEINNTNESLMVIQSKFLEMESQKFGFNQRSIFLDSQRTLYIIECNNRPEPAYFKILEYKENRLRLVGDTEPLTAAYFGDIDKDGRLEIGGYNVHCQAAYIEDFNDENFCLDHFRIYEIADAIRRDTATEKEEIRRKNIPKQYGSKSAR